MLPVDLRELADQYEARGLEASRVGDVAEAVTLFFEAGNLRRTADELEAKLREAPTSVTTTVVETNQWALKRSAGAEGGDDALAKAARAAGMTVRQLVLAVRKKLEGTDGFRGCSHVTLMRARRGTGTVWRPTAEVIEKLIGFKATLKNWPGGIRSE